MFGPGRFLNEIVWAYDYGGRAADRWPRKHDTILWYAKGERWLFDRDAIDRIPYLAPGLVGPEKAARGKLPTDVWWMTIVPPASAERTGYPTQKPVRLLERIVAASSRPGDLVLDPFAGSGTTGVAAARLGRRWLLVDRNPAAVAIARARLAAPGQASGAPVIAADHPGLRQHARAGVRSGLRGVVEETAARWPPGSDRSTRTAVLRTWDEERDRQFREEVPQFREVDLGAADHPDPGAAAGHGAAAAGRPLGRRGRGAPDRRPSEVAWAVEVYSRAFVRAARRTRRSAAARAPRRAVPRSRSCRTGRSR